MLTTTQNIFMQRRYLPLQRLLYAFPSKHTYSATPGWFSWEIFRDILSGIACLSRYSFSRSIGYFADYYFRIMIAVIGPVLPPRAFHCQLSMSSKQAFHIRCFSLGFSVFLSSLSLMIPILTCRRRPVAWDVLLLSTRLLRFWYYMMIEAKIFIDDALGYSATTQCCLGYRRFSPHYYYYWYR